MATHAARARADRIVRSIRDQAEAVVSGTDARGQRSLRSLLRTLGEADHRLTRRIQRIADAMGGAESRFTGAQAIAYREQIRAVTRQVRGSLLGETTALSDAAARASVSHTVETIAGLEEAFSGVAAPLRLREGRLLAGLIEGTTSSLLRRHEASVERYGTAMIGSMERELSQAMLTGLSQAETVDALMATGAFGARASWGWRIVRTETAYAYNEARMAALHAEREDFPDLRKKILATFDNRTAYDSVGVHGQIRRLNEPFTDGAGRVYLAPPARPNDREVVIPWRPGWDETETTREISESGRAEWRARIAARPRAPRRTPRAA